ncbi:hypothetical protein [Gordonia rhizosphera]|uniref:Uncharacterized protein n=1 Tax=Gordonia rhizosphera NBRC 16068 TaxID=1108045 RepID=K6WI70_9ACTN|nr:hypothetical protein [Gordonia rhizosphera]GAB91827.1 hypothetical protein GORHZ_150_00230 [Gordonia rhizosphera NBRC 16068]
MSESARRPAPADWEPAENRVGLLDRRGLGLSIAAGAVAVFWAFLLPLIASAVTADEDIEAGTVLDIGSGATMRPAAGWILDEGAKAGERPPGSTGGPATTVVHNGAVTLTISGGTFGGDLSEFMDRVVELQQEEADG